MLRTLNCKFSFTYGAVWADENVHCITKELHPDQFDNIFLGLGGFHMKIVLSYLGSYLEPSGNFNVLFETDGTDVINYF